MAVMQLKDKKTNKPIKDKKGRSWYFKTYYTSLTGEKKQYKSKKFISKRDAQEAERDFLIKLTTKVETSSLTFKELIASFEEYQKNNVKVTTLCNYAKYRKYFEMLYNIKISEFNLSTFNNWKKEINKTELSTEYKNNIYKFLRTILHYAEKIFDMDLNSILNKMNGFSNPNELKKEMKFWTYQEFLKFIDEEKELKYKAYFEILYYCGLRKGEANALNWNDIDFENHTISINKNVALKIKGVEWLLLRPKTKGSIRTLPIPNHLENTLKALYEEYSKYKNFKKEWFVFGGITPLKDTTVQNHKIKNCKLSGVKEIRIHDFRHSCASLLISNGASIALVAKFLGHGNISTTLNTYTHLFKNEMNDIINIINKMEKEVKN